MDGQARVQVILELKNRLKTGLNQAKEHLNKTMTDIKDKISNLKTTHIEAFKAMRDEIPMFGRVMDFATNKYVLIAAAATTMFFAMTKASDMAKNFEEKMAHANVTAQETPMQLQKTSDMLLEIAKRSNFKDAANAAPDAYNILLSSGMKKQTALDTLTPTLQAAKAGFTDIETTARAAAATMNSSGISDATRVYDILFATLNKGNAEFKDIAQYLPKIVPQALAAGSSLEQVSGAFAFLTAQGQTSEKSATLLENVFKTLSDVDKAKSFKQIGVDVYDATGKLNTLTKIATDLSVALNGLTDKQRNTVMGSLGLDMESAAGFIALSQNITGLKDTIDATTNSNGQLNEAVKNSTIEMDGWTQIVNWTNVGFIQLGKSINKMLLSPIAKFILDNSNALTVLIKSLAGAVIAWGTFAAITKGIPLILDGIKVAIRSLAVTFETNPFGLFVVGIGLVAGAILGISDNADKARNSVTKLHDSLGDLIKKEQEGATSDYNNIVSKYTTGFKAFDQHGNGIKYSLKEQKEGIAKGIDEQIKLYKDARTHFDKKQNASIIDLNYQDLAYIKKMNEYKNGSPTNVYYKPNKDVQKVLDDKQDKKSKRESSMTGSSQTKVITINKLTMVENWQTLNRQIANMDKDEIIRFLTELFQRSMINVARSYS